MIKEEASEALEGDIGQHIRIENILARKAGPHLYCLNRIVSCSHSVVELHIDDSVTLKQVLDVKEAMEHHLHEIHNMQSVVIDIEEDH